MLSPNPHSPRAIVACILFTTLLAFPFPATAAKKEPKYITPDDIDWQSIIPAPPALNSPEQKSDLDTVLDLQKKRTTDQIAQCKESAEGNAFYVARSLGSWFIPKSFPRTADLLAQANIDASSIADAAKRKYKRPRPSQTDPRVKPCLANETSPSYPSGHATRGIVWATVLSELFPDHRADLMAAGQQFGQDRIIAGVHYPTDVAAAQKLGAEIAKKLLATDSFQHDLRKAKEECLAAAH